MCFGGQFRSRLNTAMLFRVPKLPKLQSYFSRIHTMRLKLDLPGKTMLGAGADPMNRL